MAIEEWRVGRFRLVKIEETEGWTPLEFLLDVFPTATRAEIESIGWLSPTYVRDGCANTLVNCFLLETPGRRLVIDTGVGNHKPRIASAFDGLDTDFLERFELVWPRDQVDGIICTHLHMDHVGWNTIDVDGRWEPTFPNARYHFVRDEFEHWRAFAADPHARDSYSEFGYSLVDAVAVFEDSLAPIEEAGLIDWVNPGDEITPGVTLLSTAGHTPGHVAVLIEDEGESAVITGDLLHTQMQIARPDWSAEMDTDARGAAMTRRQFVENFADSSTLVIGTHFGAPSAGYIVRDGDSHRLVPAPG